MARDLRREAEELDRRLSALGIPPASAAGSETSRAAAPGPAPGGEEVAAALEQIRRLVDGLAEIQGRLQAFRGLKERLDRPRAPRTPER